VTPRARLHVVVVEAYDGLMEPLTDEPEAHAARLGSGLPLDELAEAMPARVSVLHWEPWRELERRGQLFTTWAPVPATRATEGPPPRPPSPWHSAEVIEHAIPATDPGDDRDLAARKPSLRGFGILADNDPLVYFGIRLARELAAIHARDPIDLILVPVWGGLGAIVQLERATGLSGTPDVPVVVVATDDSRGRQRVNQEGGWMREAIVRRQMESLTVALADGVLVFGERGARAAREGRLPDAAPPVNIPRRVPAGQLRAIDSHVRVRPTKDRAIPATFLYGTLSPASGALAALDAVRASPERLKLLCCGPDTRFAPMAPRTFQEYWSSRAWVAALERSRAWAWARTRPDTGSFGVRLMADTWDHLPDPWSELARGTFVLVSPAAAEGLAPGEQLPSLALLDDSTPEAISRALIALEAAGPIALEAARAATCAAVSEAHGTRRRADAIGQAATKLRTLASAPPSPQPLDLIARFLLDPRTPLVHQVAPDTGWPGARTPERATLTVIVPCFNVGPLVLDTVASIRASTRPPDELIIVDDGSTDEATLRALSSIGADAVRGGPPVTLVRTANHGLAAARNNGLARATCNHVAFLDADDLIEPDYFALALGVLERWPRLGGVAAWSVIFDENGITGHWNAPQPELPLQLAENCVFVPLLMQTDLLRSLGGFDEGQRYNYEDWELSARLLCAGHPIITIPAYLQRYRVRSDSLYRTMTPVQHQVMRERMFLTHRATVERFALELAMLLESGLGRRKFTPSEQDGVRSRFDVARWLRAGSGVLNDMVRGFRRSRSAGPT
jgi:hypothetical protein